MKTILLKLSSPLQSWGTGSSFETRHTDYYPSKSAIIGLIAACFGFKRNDDANIRKLNSLNIAFRVDIQGRMTRDFHTAKKYKNGDVERNYVTNRYYLEDSTFLVGVSSDDDEYIDDIVYALSNPYFQPFLGRRSCPVNYDFILEVNEKSIMDNFKSYPWLASDMVRIKHEKSGVLNLDVYGDFSVVHGQSRMFRKTGVCSFSQENRKFLNNAESFTKVMISNECFVETEHDIFRNMEG